MAVGSPHPDSNGPASPRWPRRNQLLKGLLPTLEGHSIEPDSCAIHARTTDAGYRTGRMPRV